jgi:hypothetical protein
MRISHFVSLAAAVLLGACDTVNVQQYRIAGGAHRDAAKVKQILHSVASQTGLVESTSTSRAPHTLVFYTQPNVQHFRVDLGARIVAEDILVDLNAGFGPTPSEFKQAERLLTPALSSEFGPRVSIAQGVQAARVETQ